MNEKIMMTENVSISCKNKYKLIFTNISMIHLKPQTNQFPRLSSVVKYEHGSVKECHRKAISKQQMNNFPVSFQEQEERYSG